eukprot:TRINITY_DN11174_c0_g1_i2.p1 TRINITY_DN11174_c0_g1~~TRINITY_DN11174_c0_g1_i2.p1  ORF type:complete len:708 (-),score=76.84 TRINITY_DN11174_c0_g1_i2:689-2812(-)
MDLFGDMNMTGLASIIMFYLLILGVGMWAARKKSNVEGVSEEEETMLAGRNIGMFVGIFTMTATWVGGGYINGTAEIVYTDGLVWCQAPFGYALSLMLGGIFFANKMRTKGYVTMLDPLQDAYGSRMGGLLFLPALCGEVFWSAGILAALGATLAIILQMDLDTAVIGSALIAVFYTWIGGLYSVAYTDVVQLSCIFLGLWICIPFAWTHPAVQDIEMSDWTVEWVGEIGGGWWNWHYADYFLLLTFGGIPWQVYFQRVLSSKSAATAELISYLAAFGCIIMAVPPVLIGGIAKATRWNETDYFLLYNKTLPIPKDDTRMILPMVLQYLTPSFVSFFGLGAVSAAVMSSADSSVLSASSMFARNVYKLIFRQGASETEIMWVMRVSIFAVGGMATYMALTIPTIYGLWALCSDLVYVILFPQLLMVVHFTEHCNTYGSLFAYCLGLVIRVSGGEKLMGLPPLVHFPGFAEPTPEEIEEASDESRRPFGTQLFPFRTMAMLLSMISLVSVSKLMVWLFKTNKLQKHHDIFKCIVNIPEDETQVTEQEEGETIGMTTNTDVKTYKSVEEVNGRVSINNGAELRKRKESIGKQVVGRQDSFIRPLEERPLTKEDLRRSFGSKQNSVDPENVTLEEKPVPTQRKVQPLRKGDRKESLKQIKQGIKEGVKEAKEVVKDLTEHLPDGHRGSIASVTERPRYKLLDKQTKQTEL